MKTTYYKHFNQWLALLGENSKCWQQFIDLGASLHATYCHFTHGPRIPPVSQEQPQGSYSNTPLETDVILTSPAISDIPGLPPTPSPFRPTFSVDFTTLPAHVRDLEHILLDIVVDPKQSRFFSSAKAMFSARSSSMALNTPSKNSA